MKCVICRVGELAERVVEEEIRVGMNVLLAPVSARVCDACGERYYDQDAMRRLEELEQTLREKADTFTTVGRVLQAATQVAAKP